MNARWAIPIAGVVLASMTAGCSGPGEANHSAAAPASPSQPPAECVTGPAAVPGSRPEAGLVDQDEVYLDPIPSRPAARWTVHESVRSPNRFTANRTTALFDMPYCSGHRVMALDAFTGGLRWNRPVPDGTQGCALATSGHAACWDGGDRDKVSNLTFLGQDFEPRHVQLDVPGPAVIASAGDGFVVAVEQWKGKSAMYAFTAAGERRWRVDIAAGAPEVKVSGRLGLIALSYEGINHSNQQILRLGDGRALVDPAALHLDPETTTVQLNSAGYTVAGSAGTVPWTYFFYSTGRQLAAAPGWRHVLSLDKTSDCRRAILADTAGKQVAAVDPATAVIGWRLSYAVTQPDLSRADYVCLGNVLSLGYVYSDGLRNLENGQLLRRFDHGGSPFSEKSYGKLVTGSDGKVVVVSAQVPGDQTTLTGYSATTGEQVWALPSGEYSHGCTYPACGGLYATVDGATSRLMS